MTLAARPILLERYLAEARRHPLLTKKQEYDLALRWVDDGDTEAAKLLVVSNLRLVVVIAREYERPYAGLLDLIQEGNIGLMEGVKRFDPRRGVRLSTYVSWWIRAVVIKFLLRNMRPFKIATNSRSRKILFNLRKEQALLVQAGIDPTPEALAQALDVPVSAVVDMRTRLNSKVCSVDAPIPGGGEYGDLLPCSRKALDQQLIEQDLGAVLERNLNAFSSTLSRTRDLDVFNNRIRARVLTCKQLGDRWGVSRQRIEQIQQRVVKRLRRFLRQEMGDTVRVVLQERSCTKENR